MALRHHSTDTRVDEAPVEADTVSGVNATPDTVGGMPATPTTVTPTTVTPTTVTPTTVTPTTPVASPSASSNVSVRVQQTDAFIPGASVGLILGGFLALLMSAWAGIIPFVGPTFGFSADGTSSWTWNQVHALGAVVPGAVGVFACAIVLVCARRPMGLQSAGSLGAAGFLLFLSGAWLAVVPVVWPVLVGSYFHVASPSLTLGYWMGYASGPGILLVGFGGLVMGRAGRESTTGQLNTV